MRQKPTLKKAITCARESIEFRIDLLEHISETLLLEDFDHPLLDQLSSLSLEEALEEDERLSDILKVLQDSSKNLTSLTSLT